MVAVLPVNVVATMLILLLPANTAIAPPYPPEAALPLNTQPMTETVLPDLMYSAPPPVFDCLSTVSQKRNSVAAVASKRPRHLSGVDLFWLPAINTCCPLPRVAVPRMAPPVLWITVTGAVRPADSSARSWVAAVGVMAHAGSFAHSVE